MSPKDPRGDDRDDAPDGGGRAEPDDGGKAEPDDGRNSDPNDGPKLDPSVGLCGTCTFVRRVENRRGSVFYRCGRSAEYSRFPKYPPLPVLTCTGFVATDPPRFP